MFGNNVDDAFFAFDEILQRVFGVGDAADDTDAEHWWVVVEELEVGEWGEIGGCSVFAAGAQEADWAGDDAGDEEFVV